MAVLDDVIYLLDTAGVAPVDLRLTGVDGAVEVEFAMVDATTLDHVGAVPKALSLNELRLLQDEDRWRCSVTLDV